LPSIVIKKEGHAFTDIIKATDQTLGCAIGLCDYEIDNNINIAEFDYYSGPKTIPAGTKMQCQGELLKQPTPFSSHMNY
jgi:hypothetical protein